MRYFVLLVCFIGLFASCDRPECITTNSVFKQKSPEDQAYKRELATIIDSQGIDAFDYWVAGYEKTPYGNFLLANIQNNNTCAIIVLEDKELEPLRLLAFNEAKGYYGAKLKGLKYEVQRHGDSVAFVCTSLRRIID